MENPEPEGAARRQRVHRSEESLFAATFRRRGCCLIYDLPSGEVDVGTGTALRHGSAMFILTCQHVADAFVVAGNQSLLRFQDIPQIDETGFDLAFRDPKLDLALLRVKPHIVERLESVSSLVLSDIGTREDYERAVPDGDWYRIAGFPADQVSMQTLADGRVTYFEMNLLTYTTIVIERTNSTMHLGYHKEAPKAPGLSGGLIFEVPREKQGKLLTPGRAIAMQHSWIDDASRIMASPLHVLRDEIVRLALT